MTFDDFMKIYAEYEAGFALAEKEKTQWKT